MHFNYDSSAVLVLASSDTDESGASYMGTSTLYWMRSDGKLQSKICGAEDGLVQDLAWSPTANEFLIIVGMMPAATKLYNGMTGKLHKDGNLGTSRRNCIRWNRFGRFFVVGGFGALPGDLDFFDVTTRETLSTFRASLTVKCSWAPSGRHFLTCTTAPRMNEDNQICIWHYNTGERLLHVPYVPENGSGGGRKAADAGAMLWEACWRPDTSGKYTDRAASPVPKGKKRVKNLPGEHDNKPAGGGGAWRPQGTGNFNSVAAMMRGELDAPGEGANNAEVRGWGAPDSLKPSGKPLTWQEEEAKKKE